MTLRSWGLTRQWGAGPAARTASAQGRCTCCSSSRSPGPAVPRDGRQPPGASHSRGSSSPVGAEMLCDRGPGEAVGASQGPFPPTGGQSRQRPAKVRVQDEGRGTPGLRMREGGPGVKTLRFHCRGRRFDPCRGPKIPHAEQCGQEKKRPNEGRKGLDEYHHYLIHRSGGLGPSQSE